MAVLSDQQLAAYERDGFVHLEAAFSRELAQACCDHIWGQLTAQPDDPSTWTQPVMRVMDHFAPPFAEAQSSPRWQEAITQVAGPHAVTHPIISGTTAIRFPVDGDPGDDGWHIDGSYVGPDGAFWSNHRSRDRALLMLVLFTDVGPDDAPTKIRVGSHHRIEELLRPFGEDGVNVYAFQAPEELHELPLALATGRAGDVYLCHPFLLHSAQRHRGTTPRLLAQPPVLWRPPVTGFSEPPS